MKVLFVKRFNETVDFLGTAFSLNALWADHMVCLSTCPFFSTTENHSETNSKSVPTSSWIPSCLITSAAGFVTPGLRIWFLPYFPMFLYLRTYLLLLQMCAIIYLQNVARKSACTNPLLNIVLNDLFFCFFRLPNRYCGYFLNYSIYETLWGSVLSAKNFWSPLLTFLMLDLKGYYIKRKWKRILRIRFKYFWGRFKKLRYLQFNYN